MKKHIYLLTVLFCTFNVVNLVSQGDNKDYTMQKIITIPIGSKSGRVNVDYLARGNGVYLPDAIAIDSQGNFIIGSRLQKNTLQKFDNDGKYITTLASRGPGDSDVNYPFDIVTDSSNSIYVLDALKEIQPNIMAVGYSVKKYNSTGKYIYKIEYDNTRPNPNSNDRIDELWVTPGGEVFFRDWYSPKIERTVYGFDSNGRLAGTVDERFRMNHKGDILVIDKIQRKDKSTYTITRSELPEEKKKAKEIITNGIQRNKSRSFKIENIPDELKFLGFDKWDNMYFGTSYYLQPGGMSGRAITRYAVYRYSGTGELLSKIEFPDMKSKSALLVDNNGNVYKVFLRYATYKKFTEGDEIEIEKWVYNK